eukprot:jgi/Botrbrau1/233/Bobra.0022s0210.1
MRPNQARQHAVAQQEAEITPTVSLELIRCLLRVSIFHVTYLRGIFPEDHYKAVVMENLEGMQIKMLKAASENSKRLIQWLEIGVHDALKNRYLKNLFFGVASDPKGSSLIEEYVFSFSYDAGELQMTVGNGKKLSTKFPCRANHKANISTVKYQTCRLMRMLVQICATLDKMPDERWLFMRLTYYPNTPEDYEPPTFVPDNQSQPAFFPRKPFSMQAGEVTTRHHAVCLKVKSILDSLDDDQGGVNVTKFAQMSMQHSTGSDLEDGDDMDLLETGQVVSKERAADFPMTQPDDGFVAGPGAPKLQVADGSKMRDEEPCTSESELVDQNFEAVKAFCLKRQEVTFHDVQCQFNRLPTGILERAIEILIEEGTLNGQGKHDCWHVNNPATDQNQLAADSALAVEGKRQGCKSGSEFEDPRVSHLSQAETLNQNNVGSRDGAVQFNAGHSRTQTQLQSKHQRTSFQGTKSDIPGDEDPAIYLEGTQPSGTGPCERSLKRKLSFVEKPICQTNALLPNDHETPHKQARQSRLKQMGI